MNDAEPTHALAREHLIRASDLLSLLLPTTYGIGVAIKGLDGRYQMANPVMESLLARSDEQIIGMNDADLFPPELAAQLEQSDRQVVSGAAVSGDEINLLIGDVPGRCLWMKFPVLAPDGRTLAIGSVILDTSH